jgi:hypothetical protein
MASPKAIKGYRSCGCKLFSSPFVVFRFSFCSASYSSFFAFSSIGSYGPSDGIYLPLKSIFQQIH